MKELLDTCVWGGAAEALRAAGHEVESTQQWANDPGDEEILARATAHNQVLVTLDKTSASWRWSGAAASAHRSTGGHSGGAAGSRVRRRVGEIW
jgi:hypothetical protein